METKGILLSYERSLFWWAFVIHILFFPLIIFPSSMVSLIQPWKKPRRLWRTLVGVCRSSRREQGNSTSTWAWSGPVSTEPSTTRAVTTRSQTPPLPSCAATSGSHCLSCRSAPTSHGYKTWMQHILICRLHTVDTNVKFLPSQKRKLKSDSYNSLVNARVWLRFCLKKNCCVIAYQITSYQIDIQNYLIKWGFFAKDDVFSHFSDSFYQLY